jgi:hypothetical protein
MVESESTILYRAVSEQEFQELMRTHGFTAGPNGLEGKWFAERGEDAVAWGTQLSQGASFRVIQVRFYTRDADQFERLTRLDNIGPARFADLQTLNRVESQIDEWTP